MKLESRVVFLGPLSTSIKHVSKFLFEGMFFLWACVCLYVDTSVCGCTWMCVCMLVDIWYRCQEPSSVNPLPYSLRRVLSIKPRDHGCGKSYRRACSRILVFFLPMLEWEFSFNTYPASMWALESQLWVSWFCNKYLNHWGISPAPKENSLILSTQSWSTFV